MLSPSSADDVAGVAAVRLRPRAASTAVGARSLRTQPRKGREGADVVYLLAEGVSSQPPDPDETSARIERPDVAVWAGVRGVLGCKVRVDDHGLVRRAAVGLHRGCRR